MASLRQAALDGRLTALRRHPVKGFTPEPLERAELGAGAPFPGDRLYAVEDGPSGFDPAAPRHVSKSRFAVLARLPQLARVRTRFDDARGELRAETVGAEPFRARLDEAEGREAFAAWLAAALDRDAPGARRGPLRVLPGGGWRFFDDVEGAVSLLNLASVEDLGRRMGARLDPERFRANLWVEGWPAWAELDLASGVAVRAGGATLAAVKPIRRCAAVHADPLTGEADLDVTGALQRHLGHSFCGLYLRVVAGGGLARGDAVAAAG